MKWELGWSRVAGNEDMFGFEEGKSRISLSRMGRAARKALASRHSLTKRRWVVVKVDEVGSSRRMAVRRGRIAKRG